MQARTSRPYYRRPTQPPGSHSRISRSTDLNYYDRRLSRYRQGPSFYFVEERCIPDGAVIDFVLETVRAVLDTDSMISLLATFVIPDDKYQSILSSLEWGQCKSQVVQVLKGSHPLYCERFSADHFGKTTRYGIPRIEINARLVRSLCQATFSDTNVWFLVGLAITTILHELAHYVRIRCHMSITPPMRHFSKYYSKDINRLTGAITIHGESGFALEALVWGGVFTGLFKHQHDRDNGNYQHIGGAVFETSPPWSITEYLHNSGPSLSRHVIDQEQLQDTLEAMREGRQVQYPVFNTADCPNVEQTPFRHYFRLRSQCSEQDAHEEPMYVGRRGPTIRIDGDIICC